MLVALLLSVQAKVVQRADPIGSLLQADAPGDMMLNDEKKPGAALNKTAANIIAEEDFAAVEAQAKGFVLNRELDAAAAVKSIQNSFDTYYWLNEWRMDFTYSRSTYYGFNNGKDVPEPVHMIWQDDKIDQVCVVEGWLGRSVYPTRYATLRTRDATPEARAKVVQDLAKEAAAGKKFVIKAANGANSMAIYPFCGSSAPSEKELKDAVDESLAAPADVRENWQIQMVLPGVVAEECYDSRVELNEKIGTKPVELKVMTAWGKVQGATLETHPSAYWFRASGEIYKWRTAQGHTMYWRNRQAATGPITDEAMKYIQDVLRKDWGQIVEDSEFLATTAGNDELRVDWFVGGAEGPKLNEVTYMGGAQRYPNSIQGAMQSSFINGYLQRGPCTDKSCKDVDIPAGCHNYADEELPQIYNQRHKLRLYLNIGGAVLGMVAICGVAVWLYRRR